MICTPCQILFGCSNQKAWNGRGIRTCGGKEVFMQGFGGETKGKSPLGRPRRR